MWVKINPKGKYEVTLEDFREGKYDYLAPAYQNLQIAYERSRAMAVIADKLHRAKLALARKIPLSEVADILAEYGQIEVQE